MSPNVKLDMKDRRILYELDSNARQSASQIAKRVKLNKNTVNYKINRLMAEGVISNFYAVIDNAKLGYFSFRIYAKFFNTAPQNEEEIINWLKANPKVGIVARIETIYDLVFMVWVKDIYEFDAFWLEFKRKFRKYLWNETVHVFPAVWHFKRKYLLEEKAQAREPYEFIGEHKLVKHDQLDCEILKLLVRDARTSIVELSEKLKVPPRTIAFRIKRLEKEKVIQGYRVAINLEKIEHEYYKINMVLNDFEKYDRLLSFAKNHPNIIYIDKTLSDLDFEIDVEIKNRQELLKLLGWIKSNFSVRDMEIFSFKEFYKLETIPQSLE